MIICREWFVILILAGLLSSSLFGKESFTFSISPQSIQPGNHAEFRIRVPLEPGESESSVLINDRLLFEQSSLQILEKTSERNQCCLEIKYDITSYKTDKITLPPVEIKTQSDSFSTEATLLEVRTLRGPEDDSIRESFSTLNHPIPWSKWLRRFLSLVVVIFAGWYLIGKAKPLFRKKRPSIQASPPPPKEDPVFWLKRQLERLRARLKEDPSNPNLIDEWAIIIREFCQKSELGPARCWTTRELKKSVQNNSRILNLIPSLEESDRFKFQPEKSTGLFISHLINKFIDETESHLILCGN